MSRTFRAASAAALAMGVPAMAASISWDGGGNSDNGGSFNTSTNWTPNDKQPGPADAVTLSPVGSGTRTITVSTATTIGSLSIAQSNNVGVNRLSLEATLSVSLGGGGQIFSRTGQAAVDKVQLDLNGHGLRLSALGSPVSGAHTHTLSGTVNFNAAGSRVVNDNDNSAHSTLNFSGDINVTADGTIGRVYTGSSSQAGNVTFNFTDEATLDVTAGTLEVLYSGKKGDDDRLKIAFDSGATATIAHGATLAARYLVAAGSSTSNLYSVLIDNNGTVNHGGTVSFTGSKISTPQFSGGATHTIDNDGTWRISGEARFQRMQTNQLPGMVLTPSFTNSGLVVGAGADDTLQYVQESVAAQHMNISMVGGTIAPGAGTGSGGLASVGQLTLGNIDLLFDSAGGKLALDVGGTAAGQYDRLVLADGPDAIGAGALWLTFTKDRLDISLVNGFTPDESFSIPILDYGSVNLNGGVGFNILTINGLTDGLDTYHAVGSGVYSIEYAATSANLVFTVPEPGAAATLLLGTAGLLRRRRRSHGRRPWR